VEIAKSNGDFRRNYGVLVGAFLSLLSRDAARSHSFWWNGLVAALMSALMFRP